MSNVKARKVKDGAPETVTGRKVGEFRADDFGRWHGSRLPKTLPPGRYAIVELNDE